MSLSSLACFCFIVLPAALTLSNAREITNPCPYESSSWCITYRRAKECDAIAHCVEHVWLQQLLPVGEGSYCDVYRRAGDRLISAPTHVLLLSERKVKEQLNQLCADLLTPKSDVQQWCIDMVEQSLALITSTVDDHQVVQSIFCKTSQRDLHFEFYNFKPLRSSLPQSKVISMLTNVRQTGTKSSYLYTNEINIPTITNYEECDLCKSTLQSLSDLLQDKNTEEVVRGGVKLFCRFMPSSIQAHCNSLVFEYTKLVITLIGQAINPERLCQLMKFCFDPNEMK